MNVKSYSKNWNAKVKFLDIKYSIKYESLIIKAYFTFFLTAHSLNEIVLRSTFLKNCENSQNVLEVYVLFIRNCNTDRLLCDHKIHFNHYPPESRLDSIFQQSRPDEPTLAGDIIAQWTNISLKSSNFCVYSFFMSFMAKNVK